MVSVHQWRLHHNTLRDKFQKIWNLTQTWVHCSRLCSSQYIKNKLVSWICESVGSSLCLVTYLSLLLCKAGFKPSPFHVAVCISLHIWIWICLCIDALYLWTAFLTLYNFWIILSFNLNVAIYYIKWSVQYVFPFKRLNLRNWEIYYVCRKTSFPFF